MDTVTPAVTAHWTRSANIRDWQDAITIAVCDSAEERGIPPEIVCVTLAQVMGAIVGCGGERPLNEAAIWKAIADTYDKTLRTGKASRATQGARA